MQTDRVTHRTAHRANAEPYLAQPPDPENGAEVRSKADGQAYRQTEPELSGTVLRPRNTCRVHPH